MSADRYYCAKDGTPATVVASSIGLDGRFGMGRCPNCSPNRRAPDDPTQERMVLVVRADYAERAAIQVRQANADRARLRAARRPARPF